MLAITGDEGSILLHPLDGATLMSNQRLSLILLAVLAAGHDSRLFLIRTGVERPNG
jgi:hypothetical protein